MSLFANVVVLPLASRVPALFGTLSMPRLILFASVHLRFRSLPDSCSSRAPRTNHALFLAKTTFSLRGATAPRCRAGSLAVFGRILEKVVTRLEGERLRRKYPGRATAVRGV